MDEAKTGRKRKAAQVVGAVLMVVAMFGMIAWVSSQRTKTSGPDSIRAYLQGYGIDASDVEFTLVEERGFFISPDIYQASRVVEYNGYQVAQWAVTTRTTGGAAGMTTRYVEPYPAVPEPVVLYPRVVVSDKDNARIQQQIAGESLDEYITRLIREDLERQE